MRAIIYPRSPREAMCGWVHLPRYIDKIRLHLAGCLHAAGLTHEQFVEVVKNTITDGEVADWVLQNLKKSDAEKTAHATAMLNQPKPGDAEGQALLKMRKAQAGLAHLDDIETFVDFIDADEKRL